MLRKDRVSFDTLNNTIVRNIENGLVTDIVSIQMALIKEPNIYAINDALYASLGLTQNSVVLEDDDFYFIVENGETKVYASSWIDTDSIELVTNTKTLKLELPTITDEEINYIIHFLNSAGFSYNKNIA